MQVFFFYVKSELKNIVQNAAHTTYSVSHISIHPPDFSGNQGNLQNFEKSLLSYKCGLIFVGMKEKKIYFFEKMKFKMAGSKKGHFSKSPILNIFV